MHDGKLHAELFRRMRFVNNFFNSNLQLLQMILSVGSCDRGTSGVSGRSKYIDKYTDCLTII